MTNLSLQTANSTPFNTSINTANNIVKMTSLEIVEFINNHRQANATFEKPYAELRHSDFIRKVPIVLGEQAAQRFFAVDTFTNGTGGQVQRSVYIFPKREACLMGMSYSYDLQAEIYDRMTAMEHHILMMNRPSYMIEDPIERAKKWIVEATAKQEIEMKLVEAAKAIEEMQPTVDAYDLIAGRRGVLKLQDAYKFLGGMLMKEMKKWMHDKRWIYFDRHGEEKVSQPYIVNGYLVVKVTAYKPQIKITYKGLAAMARQMKIELNTEDFQ